MGNTLPISNLPKPSSTRAVIFMQPQCIRGYIKEPWRHPAGELQIVSPVDTLPCALDAVPLDVYQEMMSSVADRIANFRGRFLSHVFLSAPRIDYRFASTDRHISYENILSIAGLRVHVAMNIFQACLFIVVVLGFFLTKYNVLGQSFFNPITFGVLGTLEFTVLSITGRYFQREESVLIKELLALVKPRRQQYNVIGKVRKTRGKIGEDREGKAKSSNYYCLVLDKILPDTDVDTVSISSSAFTEIESDVESQV